EDGMFKLDRCGADAEQPGLPSGRREPVAASVRTWTRAIALALGIAVMSAAFTVVAPAAQAACAPDPVLCPERIYVGASVDGLPGGPAVLAQFTKATGVAPSAAMA